METLKLFLFASLLLAFIKTTSANIYSKESNNMRGDINFEKEIRPFRMNKVNLLWTIGKKVLTLPKLAELYAELSVHDKLEAKLKKAKADDSDEDGLLEAKCLENYNRITHNFGLEESRLDNEILSLHKTAEVITFTDTKLQSMWDRAQQMGFDEKDLITLKEEFQHQQMKIDQFDFIHRNGGSEDNMIDSELSVAELKERHQAMKRDKISVHEGYLQLEGLVSSLPAPNPNFSDARVYKLWALAKKTNWTQEELDRFKRDLLHFESRLSKQAHFEEKLSSPLTPLAGAHKYKEIDLMRQRQEMEEKKGYLDKVVTKLYSHLKTKLDKGLLHMEL